ncbi:MAG TPA: BON domain-containing protein [Oligoflexus sp.]|uniref:BON domain-containing protein n=1 Tax=Oligoflexus sp. TaxID=1971216 RepID=UPI002D80AFC8|nr:BON domain-containing protein [Oligoflexus sp.]HET9241671.1 BON domain-containing protein [Oligoflexus sp.]
MFEQSHENEDRYTQQGRRSQSPFNDRRSYSRGQDDRFEDRYRYRGQDSERRYTRPDYDSDLDIERPGQAHFGSRGGADYGREYNQDHAWQRPYRSQGSGDRYGYEGSRGNYDFSRGGVDYGSYGRGMSDWGRGLGDYGHQQSNQGRGSSEYGRDYSTGSGMGHADWNRLGSDDRDQNQGWGRRSYDQQGQQSSWNEQRSRWPKSYKRSDERIKDDIHEELIRHGRIDASDVEVQVKDGEVTLTGQVSSRQDKRVAEELAEKVLGVHDVQNQLRVRNQQQGSSSSASSPNLPGTNRMSVAGQQQQDPNKSTVNSTNR